MSTAKVIFTYKRKRLSSHSGVDHEDVCADLDVQADKHQDFHKETIKSPEKDLMIFERVNCNDVDCSMNSCLEPFDNQRIDFQLQHVCPEKKTAAAHSSVGLDNSSTLVEKYDVQIFDTINTREMIVGSHELPKDYISKTSGENISVGASLGEITSTIKKDSCLLYSSSLDIEGYAQVGSVSQSVENDSKSIFKQSYSSKSEVAKGKSVLPLRTFSRRLKRKVYACGEGDTATKESDFGHVPSCTCEVASKERSLVEKSVDLKVENNDADTNMLCQSCEKMINSEIGDCSHTCRQSCVETPILKHTVVTSDSQEDLVVNPSPVTKQTTTNGTSGSIASAFHHPDALGSTSLQKDDIRCSSNDGTVVSSCDVANTKDEQPVSQQLRASSGDSQLTSSDSSDLKIGAAKRVEEHRSCSDSLDLSHLPHGAFVIDCNVVPESDVLEEASNIVQDSLMAGNCEKVMQERHMKSKGLELFGDNSVRVEDPPDDSVHTSIRTETIPKTKSLQLFSEDEKCGKFTAGNLHSEIGHSKKTQQNVEFSLHSQRLPLEQSSCKASADLGLSLATEQLIYEGQTSKGGPTIHQFPNPNVRMCDFNQNPVIQSPPDHPASFRHKSLLESINTRATSLRGNRNISLDKFEPCPAMWSEEELDSLWIGIRRHGRGHWRAMLLDPKLRFAPWRVAGQLEEQWEREQYKLFSGQPMPSSRYLKPQETYKLHCHGPAICPGTSGRRENASAEMQLSLGDLYAQKDSLPLRSSAQSYGITQAQRHVTMASCSLGSYYGCCSFNNVQASSVMIRGEVSPDGPAMAFGMNSCLPHWLRDPVSIPPRPLDLPPTPPPISTLPQMVGPRLVHAFPETSGTSCRGKNLINSELARVNPNPPSRVHYGRPLPRKPGMGGNLIVIDSDASSEETISDDHNIRS